MSDVKGEIAIGVIENEGKYLVLKRSERTSSSGKWCFPGGKIERNETPEETVLREIKEETDLETEIIRRAEVFETKAELGVWKVHPFLLKTDPKQVELNYEHSESKWVKLNELNELDNLGDMKAPEALKII